jgi:hypothetical protein
LLHASEFAGILDGAQVFHSASGGSPPETALGGRVDGLLLRDGDLSRRIGHGDEAAAGNVREGVSGGSEEAVGYSFDANALNFLTRLKGIATVDKQNGVVGLNQQECRTAGEAGKVKNIGKMRNEERVSLELGKTKPEPIDSAPA